MAQSAVSKAGSSRAAFAQRQDLKAYGNNGLLLFALELSCGIEDVHTVAANALTDGPDDKKCDLLYVDRDLGKAVIAQGYASTKPNRAEAPANKAGDLNTAVAWLLAGSNESLPAHLQAAWRELDLALRNGEIRTLDIWYCHNLPESVNVARELWKVQATADNNLKRHYPDASVSVTAMEVGTRTLDEWYDSRRIPILLADSYQCPIGASFETEGDGWTSITASVPLKWLHTMYTNHGRQLFSANVRDYLGSRKSDRNINYGIKETARAEPGRFWAYNNGVTALVNDYELTGTRKQRLRITGIAIVNGAQTTGAIGSLKEGELGDAAVLARFVKTSDKRIVDDIIRYNNTQNKIDPADFRSNDPTQERLRAEFGRLPDCLYLGFRRGGDEDKIKRPQKLIPSHTAAQALVAFHQDPNVAYNEKSQIWEVDALYGNFYSEKLKARHLLFSFSALRAVEEEKRAIASIPEAERTESQRSQAAFFRQRGSTLLLCAAIGRCIEIYLGKPVSNAFELAFSERTTPNGSIEAWRPLVKVALPFVGQLMPAAEAGIKNRELIRQNIDTFRSLVEATAAPNAAVFRTFRRAVKKAG